VKGLLKQSFHALIWVVMTFPSTVRVVALLKDE